MALRGARKIALRNANLAVLTQDVKAMALTTPRTMPGTLELLPREQIVFQRMLDTIRRTFETYGFLPIETP
ncbi:MAG: hypothetical protein ACREPS_04200, partial [Rhodanobacteraceae bacterium]